MNRKYIFSAIILSLALLCSCSTNQVATTQTPESSPSETVENLTGNTFLDAEVKTAPGGNGLRAYIAVTKEDAKAASVEDYAAFLAERVDGSGYNWWTVFFDDGTGIQYVGSMTYAAQYGMVSASDGTMVEPYGNVVPDDDGGYIYQSFDDENNADVATAENNDDATKTSLENIFAVDGCKTTVSVADGKANVWLSGPFYNGTEKEKASMLSSFMSLHNSARDIIAYTGEYSLSTTLCTTSDIPVYGIEDGEVIFDILTDTE